MMILFWVLIAAGIVFLVIFGARFTSRPDANGTAETPRQVVQKRYARGEIGREQYQEMLRDLEGPS